MSTTELNLNYIIKKKNEIHNFNYNVKKTGHITRIIEIIS